MNNTTSHLQDRRKTLAFTALALVCMATSTVRADSYPSKPIRIVVPYSGGGAPDILARIFAAEMSKEFGKAYVDNRPGAGGNIGADNVAKSPADGYSLLLTTTATQSINPALYTSIPYDPIKDFTPIALVAFTPLMLATSAQAPYKSVADVVAAARSEPGSVSFASSGVGTMQHIAGELMQQQAGVSMLHVPYKGSGSVLPDLMTGRVSVMFNSTAALEPFVKSGKLRVIAVTTPQRLPAWPDVPTMSESGMPGYSASAWYAIYAPANLQRTTLESLHSEIVRIVGLKSTHERYAELGLELPQDESAAELASTTKRDLARWTALIKAKNIRVN